MQQAMLEGKLAPVEAIRTVLDQELRRIKSVAVLLDGFPRSLEQMTMFEDSVSLVYFPQVCFLRVSQKVLTDWWSVWPS